MSQLKPTRTVDVAIIGGGTAGLAAYRAATQHTSSVLMIEAGPYGTTCARVGCMPSKLLIAAAENAHQYEKSAQFGVNLGKPRIDGAAVMQRVKTERDRFVGFVLESVDGIAPEHKLDGYAEFIDPHHLTVQHSNGDTSLIQAKRIVIASGSRPAYPAAWQSLGERLLINDDIFAWDNLPKSVAVFGPGVIGLEIGQALHRLGVRVLMFGVGGAVGPLSDPALTEYANSVYGQEFYLDSDAKVSLIERSEQGVKLAYQDKQGQTVQTEVDYLIAATGRRPNTDKLGLDKLDIDLDARGVPRADHYTLQTSLSHIFIAGDASNQIPLLHEAADQGKIAGDNAGRGHDIRAGLRRTPIAAVFSDPQIAMVGESYRDIEKRLGGCGCFEVGSVSFENQGRSRVMLVNKGLAHLYGEQGTGRFLGAEIIGPNAEHLAHLLAWAHQAKMTVSQMLDMPFYHPVVEEGIRTALRELNAKLHLGPEMLDACMECGVGS